jgi:hypothetical protein
MSEKTDRRGFLHKSLLGAAGVGAACTLEENILLAAIKDGAAQNVKAKPEIAPGSLSCGKIGNVTVSRIILGCNLIGGYAHSRDLLYVSNLFRAYNTEAKIFETVDLAQECGINTMIAPENKWPTLVKYNQRGNKKIQFLANFVPDANKTKMGDSIKLAIDNGAVLLYTHGHPTDLAVMNDKIDMLGEAIETAKREGVPVGVGGHSLEVPMACEKHKLGADFYVKTFHMDRYWSATPSENRSEFCWYKQETGHDFSHDNMWCMDAEKTAAFMETVEKPWVAFKVMAAGAIQPRMAFPHAFRHGADFVAAGMFDFQLEDDVKIAIESLKNVGSRKRLWRG